MISQSSRAHTYEWGTYFDACTFSQVSNIGFGVHLKLFFFSFSKFFFYSHYLTVRMISMSALSLLFLVLRSREYQFFYINYATDFANQNIFLKISSLYFTFYIKGYFLSQKKYLFIYNISKSVFIFRMEHLLPSRLVHI